MKKSTSGCVVVYGLILVILGYVGYTEGSPISFYMGGGCGAALILSGAAMWMQKKWASYIALVLTALLTISFAVRYSLTSKTIPGGLAIVSAAMLIYLLAQTTKWRR